MTINNHTYGIIYQATNIINGKIYIGQTTDSLKVREANHYAKSKKAGKTEIFRNAIRKYGRDNFIWEILCKCYSKIELDEKEQEYVWLNNSSNRECGYNIHIGGANGSKIDIKDAIKLFREGNSIVAISKKLNCDKSHIRSRLKFSLGENEYKKILQINRNKKNNFKVIITKEQLQFYIDQEITIQKISLMLKINLSTVTARIKYYFGEDFYNSYVMRVKTNSIYKITKEQLQSFLDKNMSFRKIAQELNVSTDIIHHRIKYYFGEDFYKSISKINRVNSGKLNGSLLKNKKVSLI